MNDREGGNDTMWPSYVVRFSILIWIVLFLAGLFSLLGHSRLLMAGSKHEQFLALRLLQANHRIVDGDIAEAGPWHPFLFGSLTTRDDFNGRYVTECVDGQDPVDIEKTVPGPNLTTKEKRSIAWVPLRELPAAEVATLDVHRELEVCNLEGDGACGNLPVEAIACTGKTMDADTCSAGIQITEDQRRRLLRALDKADAAAKTDASAKTDAAATPDPAKNTATPKPASGNRKAVLSGKPGIGSTIRVLIHHDELDKDGKMPVKPNASRCPLAASTPAPVQRPGART